MEKNIHGGIEKLIGGQCSGKSQLNMIRLLNMISYYDSVTH